LNLSMGNVQTMCVPAQTQAGVAQEDSQKPYSQFRSTAVKAVEKASQCTAQIQGALVSQDVLIKKDKSPVTIADLACQIILIHELSQVFPQVPFIAEESSRGLTDEIRGRLMEFLPNFIPGITPELIPTILDKGKTPIPEGSSFCWTIDPVDGTEGFLRREQYAVCLALLENFVPVLGVLGCPSLPTKLSAPEHMGTLLVAVKGQGCWTRQLGTEGETQCKVATAADASDVICTESPNTAHSSPHVTTIFSALKIRKSSIKIDSQCKYVLVARGEAGLYLRYSPNYAEKIWDHAAGLVCVQEAGGQVTDVENKPLDFSQGRTLSKNIGIIASNRHVHANVAAAVAAVDPIGKDAQKVAKH